MVNVISALHSLGVSPDHRLTLQTGSRAHPRITTGPLIQILLEVVVYTKLRNKFEYTGKSLLRLLR